MRGAESLHLRPMNAFSMMIPAGALLAAGSAYAVFAASHPASLTQDGPRLELESLDGKLTYRGPGGAPITSLSKVGAAFIRFEGMSSPTARDGRIPPEDRCSVELAGGDRLTVSVRGGSGDTLRVALRGGVELELSVEVIRSLLFAARIPDSVTSSPVAGDDGDRLYLLAAGGSLDRAVGFVEEFNGDGVVFEDERLGSRAFDWPRVAALFITAFDEDKPDEDDRGEGGGKQGQPREKVSVSLVGGGRLSGELVEILGPEEGVVLALGGTSEVRLPGKIVTEVVLADGSFEFLGERAPDAEGASSLFGDDLGFAWPMQVDRNVRGGALVVAGDTYGRGMGVHAPSELRWDLKGEGWKELRFACGVDDTGARVGSAGSVKFRVLGDAKVLWESEVLRAGGAAVRPASVALEGVETLILEVDPAGEFTLDRADWLRVMLVK